MHIYIRVSYTLKHECENTPLQFKIKRQYFIFITSIIKLHHEALTPHTCRFTDVVIWTYIKNKTFFSKSK